jgi:thymidine kinase
MIELITGPMFSGKSTLLFQKMERYVYAGKRVVLIRPEQDTREFFSHSPLDTALRNLVKREKIDIIMVADFLEYRLPEKYDTVFVDEYFMIKNCWHLACGCSSEQNIYFAGLLATSECKLFDEAIQLLPYCDSIIKLNGVCTRCGSQDGNYSYYRKGSKKEEIVVGDNEYTCLCRDCYMELQDEKKSQMQLL